jgi:oxalate decarboxylase/phosphoglucose isomerase-like protein (cupin superfamily)
MATYRKRNILTKKTKARGKGKSVPPNLFYEYSLFFRKDTDNVIFQVTSDQLPILNRIGLDDLFMTKGHIREPHWHPNAAEMDYVVTGEVVISVLDPIRHQLLTYRVTPGQVIFIPKGWFHWIIPDTEDAHMLVYFNDGKIESVEGSDVLRLTPPEVFQQAYDIHARQFAKEVAPITETLTIGPPSRHRR